MTATQIVQNLLDKVYEYKKELDGITVEVSKAQAVVTEFQRQIDYHLQRGNTVDATIVKGWLSNAESILLKWTIEEKRVKGLYDDALREYTERKQSLLTPQESEAMSQAESLMAEQENQAKALELQKTQFQIQQENDAAAKVKRNKMIMTAAIVLGVAILGYFVWKKYVKK